MSKINLAVRQGYYGSLVVSSLSSADITVNGVTKTPTAVGNDRGSNDPAGSQTACYNAIFSGLSGAYTATQGSEAVSGVVESAPGAGDDYTLIFASCDKLGDFADPTGMYGYIKHVAETANLKGHAHLDDVLYCDTTTVDDTGYTGKVATTTPESSPYRIYDRALVYCAQLGLMGNPKDIITRMGHSPSRQWVYQNVPQMLMWGDHEFANNNPGYDNNASTHTSFIPGYTTWDAFYGQITPPRLNAATDHSEAIHWGFDLGDLQVVAVDRVSKGDGSTVLYGSTQIADIKSAMAGSAAPFKVLGLTNSIRYLHATLTGLEYAANEPLADERAAEWSSLMTDASAVQDLAASGGWNFLTIHGDHHNPLAIRHENTDGTVAESFMQIGCGTINGSQNHVVNASIVPGLSVKGSTVEYADPVRATDTYKWSCVRVDVYGSEDTKRMVVSMIDDAWQTVWQGEWREGQSGNLPGAVTKKTASGCGID